MHVLFDMQDVLENAKNLDDMDYIRPSGSYLPMLKLEQQEDVKAIRVSNREDHKAGVGINLSAIPGIQASDRITITGRISEDAPTGAWGIALLSDDSANEISQLAQMGAPKFLYVLSYILGEDDLKRTLVVQTTQWGAISPSMDFLIDNILIFRGGKFMEEQLPDTRDIIYSLENDFAVLAPLGVLRRSGKPIIRVLKHNGLTAVYVGNRNNDWDGLDIELGKMGLLGGNTYQVTVTGRIDGEVPKDPEKDARLMLQGMPDYSWRSVIGITDNQEFTLSHTLTQSEIENWKFIRVTSDKTASIVPFFIYSIEVKRLG